MSIQNEITLEKNNSRAVNFKIVSVPYSSLAVTISQDISKGKLVHDKVLFK